MDATVETPKHSLKEWVAATRYWSFSVSSLPAVATACYLASLHGAAAVNWVNVVLAVIGVVLFHAAGNLLSDVGDFRSGADCKEAFAVPNLVEELFLPKQYLRFSAALFAIGIAIGFFLAIRSSWQLLAVGGLGFVMTLLYTKSKNVFLSDIDIFLIFGVLVMLGTSIVSVGAIDWRVLLLSVPLGLITLSVLHANNTLDILTDGRVGIHTLAMAMGERRAVGAYIAYQLLPFLWVAGCVAAGLMAWPALSCLLALALAVGNIKKARAFFHEGRNALVGLDLMSAKLQLVFSLLLAAGLMAGTLL